MSIEQATARVRAAIEQYGLLLMQDAKLPSLVSIVAGAPVKGSWWSHPESARMFDVLQVIHDETLVLKLLAGKRTFVHPRLWPAVCAVAESGEPWQTSKLAADGRALLGLVTAHGSQRTDQLELPPGSRKLTTVADDLEKRLLLHARDEHTERGHHARVLCTWEDWRRQARVLKRALPTPVEARALITAATASYASPKEAARLLPWR